MSKQFAELYQPDQHFGAGVILGEDNFFTNFTEDERVLLLAMLDACPEPHAMMEMFGKEWILNRYLECNLVWAIILEKAKELNKELAKKLEAKSPRKIEKGEVPTGYESDAVPSDYATTLYSGSTAPGYAASRILIEQFGREEPWKIGDERVKFGIEELEYVIMTSSTPVEFLVRLAKRVSKPVGSADPTAVLGHLLAAEFKGEAIYSQIKEIARALRRDAPLLWEHYLSLSEKQRDDAGMLPADLVM